MRFIKSYLSEMLLSIVILLLLGIYALIGLYYFYEYNDIEKNNIVIEEDTNKEEVQTNLSDVKMYVDVKGAVQSPGVYEISNSTIINDVITLAGGFKNNAYTKNINLSKKINDETVIYVYTAYEYSLLNAPLKKEECVCPETDISSCVNSGSSVIENAGEETSTKEEDIKEEVNDSKEELININTASLEELTTLNGIGEAKAKSIIEYRNANGLFVSIEDIKKVSGISDSLYEKIKDHIKV